MPSILLPNTPGLRSARPRLMESGGFLTPVLGGPIQRIDRLGDRYAIDIELPPMPAEPTGRLYLSKLRQARRQGALYAFPQDGFDAGAPGTPLVDGAGQTGTTLNVKGLTPHYAIRQGQFFSLIHNSRRYLHCVAAQVIADATGDAAVPLEEMLRVSPADNAVCEFAKPMIEGWVMGDAFSWEIMLDPFVAVSFTIAEIE